MYANVEALGTKFQQNSYPEVRMVWPWLAQETWADYQKQTNEQQKKKTYNILLKHALTFESIERPASIPF